MNLVPNDKLQPLHIEDLATPGEWGNLLATGKRVYFSTDKELSQQLMQLPKADCETFDAEPGDLQFIAEQGAVGCMYFVSSEYTYNVFHTTLDNFDWDTFAECEVWVYEKGYLMRFATFHLKEQVWTQRENRWPHSITYNDDGCFEHLVDERKKR